MDTSRKYKGVCLQPGSKANPWRGQIVLGGKPCYLGSFPTDEEAAKAYDNAAFYTGRSGRCRRTKLNFPEDYAAEPYPEATGRTVEILADVEARMPPQSSSAAQIWHFPDREIMRHLVQRLVAARRAEGAATKAVDGLLAELSSRLSIDSGTVQREVEFMQRLEKNSGRLQPYQVMELHRLQHVYKPEPSPTTADSKQEPRRIE